MSEVNEYSSPWRDDLAHDAGTRYAAAGNRGGGIGVRLAQATEFGGVGGNAGGAEMEDWRFHMVEFAKGLAEMSVELGKGCRDVVKQSVVSEDSYIMRKLGGPCKKVCGELRFLNEYLPEDRDPVHSCIVIFFVVMVAFAALYINTECDTSRPSIKKLYIHPPNATRIILPDGRHLAYQEQGVPADTARFSIIAPHSFLSSRLAGIPGLKDSLLQDFGVRLLTYDLPGFGESDPHPRRNLESSALDMLHLSYAVGVTDKFWVVGFSGGSMHVWAALKYIPDRIAGAFMVAPMVNPYELSMSNEERSRSWEKWTMGRKLMYFLARKFPIFLPYFYRRSFLSGNVGPIDNRLSLSLGKRDRSLIAGEKFQDFWERDVGESVRQGNVKPFVEEAVLQVSNWGFSLSYLKVKKKHGAKGVIFWLKSLYTPTKKEDLTGFLGPIHIWQGMDDRVVPPSMTDFIQRVLPGVMVHKLLYEGHFTYFYFCDECHRHIFGTLFGSPQGPLVTATDRSPMKENNEDMEEVTLSDSAQDTVNFSS